MAGKFMKIKRLVIPMLVLIAILAQTTPAFAMDASAMAEIIASNPAVTMEYAEVDAITGAAPIVTDNHDGTFTYDKTGLIVNDQNEKVGQAAPSASMSAELTMLASNTSAQQGGFTDVDSNHWAKGAIKAMSDKGVIQGFGDGSFGPSRNVTRSQFAVMAMRAMGVDVDGLAAEMSAKAATESGYSSLDKINAEYQGNWSNSIICAIQAFPELDSKWQCSKVNWEAEATRADMALIVMTIFESRGTETFNIKDGIENNIPDYLSLGSTGATQAILKAYSNGILVGTDDSGTYNPNGLSNRAQAATIMQRAIDPSKRESVQVKPAAPPTTETGENVGSLGEVYPTVGSTFNGIKVARDADTGILGLDMANKVYGGIYLGIQINRLDGSSYTIKVGSLAADDYDNMQSGSIYQSRNGYTLWGNEFSILARYAQSRLPQASKALAGQTADIKGNTNSDAPDFYVCRLSGAGDYRWTDIDMVPGAK